MIFPTKWYPPQPSHLNGQSWDGSLFEPDVDFGLAFTRRHVPQSDHIGLVCGEKFKFRKKRFCLDNCLEVTKPIYALLSQWLLAMMPAVKSQATCDTSSPVGITRFTKLPLFQLSSKSQAVLNTWQTPDEVEIVTSLVMMPSRTKGGNVHYGISIFYQIRNDSLSRFMPTLK